ncbi:uncharacterized protein LOC117338453 [Pecten maximus]|uniref:uncharacterized protein LOC117338453 n=1 Tax=Pecten maximus TaxID=6579 RepID=UPI00145877E2|nr:uncharacterized protein LOC117338453 [Pecten maximus]
MEMWHYVLHWILLWPGWQCAGACDRCGACLEPPAFISNFTSMRAQSATESTLTIAHGLGEVPIKVEVQVRPSPGRPNTEYVFPGLGSAQSDDDLPQTYGGVVYKYNDQYVMLAVPAKNNHSPTGVTIYTVSGLSF